MEGGSARLSSRPSPKSKCQVPVSAGPDEQGKVATPGPTERPAARAGVSELKSIHDRMRSDDSRVTGSQAPHFRTHAFDHIRLKGDDKGIIPKVWQHPQHHYHLLPLPAELGHADTGMPSPIPAVLPTERGTTAFSARFMPTLHTKSPALSPVPMKNGLSRWTCKELDEHEITHVGSLRARRPASADPTRRVGGTRTKKGSLPRARGRENAPLNSTLDHSEPTHRRPHLVMDLDATFASVGSVVSLSLNHASLPIIHDSHDVSAADSVGDTIKMLERGHAPRIMNLRGALDGSELRDVERIFEHISVARTIQALNLSCNHFSDAICWSLERMLEKNRSCVVLRLGNNRMTDKMCAGAIAALYRNSMSRVVEVYLGNNQAGMMTADGLARALRPAQGGLQHVQILNMSHNRLGDTGGALLVDALKDNVSLKTLDIGSNDLAYRTKTALCKTLKFNRSLLEIRIERNPGLEDQGGLIDILTTLRFSMNSELKMVYTVEPLGLFCMDADRSGRETTHWDNRTVLRFVRDIRLWYGDSSKALFPISSQMWSHIHKCIKRVETVLLKSALLEWHRVCFAHAASRVRFKWHQIQVLKKPYFNLWVNNVTKIYEEPRFVERCRILNSKTVLLYLTIWRLRWRHKKPFAAGTNWTWRISLSEDSIQICQRAMGKFEFTSWYTSWSQYHFLWHALSVKYRHKTRRSLHIIFAGWSLHARDKRRRERLLRDKFHHSVMTGTWKLWHFYMLEAFKMAKLMQKSGQRLIGNQLAFALSTWRHKSQEALGYKNKVRLAMQILGYLHLETAIKSWKKLLAQKRYYLKCLGKSDLGAMKLLMKCTHTCTTYWREFHKFKKVQRQKVKIGHQRILRKALLGWKPLRGRREEKQLKQGVLFHRWDLRRCKTVLRDISRYVQKCHRLQKSLHMMLHNSTMETKHDFSTWWRREASGTRLHKERYCKRLQGRAIGGWVHRLHLQKQVRKMTNRLAKPRRWRMQLKAFIDWQSYTVTNRVRKVKVGRLLHSAGKKDEEQFFIAWVEGVRNQMRRKARLHKGLSNIRAKYLMLFYGATSISCRQRRAASILFNFGEDRYLTFAMREWKKWVQTRMRERIQTADRKCSILKETRLERLGLRIKAKTLMRQWQEWRKLTSVPRSWLRGYESYKGLSTPSELHRFCARWPQVDVPRLLEKLSLDKAEGAGLLLKEVLMHWHKMQCNGDLECKLELHRFLAYLCQGWSSGEIPEGLTFGDINLISRDSNLSAYSGEDGAIIVALPKVDTSAELRCRIQRGLAIGLCPAFKSALSLPCPLLKSAHEFCRDFLRVPPGFLDFRGDHERWTETCTRPVGEPPKNYVSPVGWVRVGVRVDDAVVNEHNIWDRWNISFHAVRQEMVSQIIHSRMLLRPGDVGAVGRTMHTIPGVLDFLGKATHKTKFVVVPKLHGPDTIEEQNSVDRAHCAESGAEEFIPSKYFLTSPSVIFVSQLSLSSPVSWHGRKAQVLLQTRQRPDATRVLAFHEQIPPIDPSFPNEDLRWFTSSYGPAAIAVTGILFRFAD